MGIVFVDCETTGLDADRHEVWEVGVVVDGNVQSWLLPVRMELADPISLGIGRFHERHPQGNACKIDIHELTMLGDFAEDFAAITHGHHLVGALVSFDEERLRKLLLGQGYSPSWHYHIIDVEALMVGFLAAGRAGDDLSLPWKSEDLSRAVGVNPDQFAKHTGVGDALWAKACYEAVMGTT
jgi:DNA polymerase III epsilon subunit-like protein